MTLTQLRNKANAKLADMWPVIQSRQDAYFTKHGKYFGLRWSPSSAVVDGVDTTLTLNRPSRGHVSEDVTWGSDTVPYQIRIFRINQDTPEETFQAFVRVELPNGDKWERNRYQDNTDSGWYQIITSPYGS